MEAVQRRLTTSKTQSRAEITDLIVYFCIAVFFIFNLIFFDYTNSDFWVVFTFYLIGIFSFYRIVTAKKNISAYRMFYIFTFIFLFFAPLQQYLNDTVLWKDNGHSLIYTNDDYLFANIMIIVFISLFEISFYFSKTKQKPTKISLIQNVQSSTAASFCLVIVSMAFLVILIITGNLTDRSGLGEEGSALAIQVLNIMRFFPIACLIVSFLQKNIYGSKTAKIRYLFLVETVIIYFPFNGGISRFLLFGVYLSLITLFFSKTQTKSLFFLLMVIGFFFVLSSFNFFKFNNLSDWKYFTFKLVDFNHADYDAYQMFMTAIKYTKDYGVLFGKNMISALLCFIPRSFWSSKLEPSGVVIMQNYGSWFTNVSCPWVAECYLAFGVIGVAIGAVVSAKIIKSIDLFAESDNFFKKTIAYLVTGLMIYILRGAILPAISFTYAYILSLILVCIINKFFELKT